MNPPKEPAVARTKVHDHAFQASHLEVILAAHVEHHRFLAEQWRGWEVGSAIAGVASCPGTEQGKGNQHASHPRHGTGDNLLMGMKGAHGLTAMAGAARADDNAAAFTSEVKPSGPEIALFSSAAWTFRATASPLGTQRLGVAPAPGTDAWPEHDPGRALACPHREA